jgi:hypothetical protein
LLAAKREKRPLQLTFEIDVTFSLSEHFHWFSLRPSVNGGGLGNDIGLIENDAGAGKAGVYQIQDFAFFIHYDPT